VEGERPTAESLIAEDFVFTSPQDDDEASPRFGSSIWLRPRPVLADTLRELPRTE
jgi:hypothetical protein